MRQMIPVGRICVLKYTWRRWLVYLENKRLEKEVNLRSAAKWHTVLEWLNEDEVEIS